MTHTTKTHDEARQGEAIDMAPVGKSDGRKLYIESYGCQMNFSDSEIVASILIDQGFATTTDYKEADVVFINTCSIRENAEQRVRNRLKEFEAVKTKNPGLIVGVLGCMAERLKSKFLEEEKLVDVVVGPDAYRDLPNLIDKVDDGSKASMSCFPVRKPMQILVPYVLIPMAFLRLFRSCADVIICVRSVWCHSPVGVNAAAILIRLYRRLHNCSMRVTVR